MIIGVLLLTTSAYITYRLLRFCHRFALVHEKMPPPLLRFFAWSVFIFQILTCMGLSFIALEVVAMIRANP